MQEHSIPKSLSWSIGFLILLLTAGAIGTAAQAPANSRFDRLVANAEKGDAAAQVELGILDDEGLADSRRPNYAKALEWFQRAADQGDAKAQDRIGLMYYSGKGVPQDFAQAAHWYQLAAQAEITMRGCSSAICTSGDWACRAIERVEKMGKAGDGRSPRQGTRSDSGGIRPRCSGGDRLHVWLNCVAEKQPQRMEASRGCDSRECDRNSAGADTLTTYGFGSCSLTALIVSSRLIARRSAILTLARSSIRSVTSRWSIHLSVYGRRRFSSGCARCMVRVYLCRLLIRRPRARVPGAVPSRNF